MRLIDADEIDFNEVFVGASEFAEDTRQAGKMLIDAQPTAYDVDKVIKQLEDKVKEYDERIEKRKGANFFDETERIKQFDERAWDIENAIEIVKGGGIDGR